MATAGLVGYQFDKMRIVPSADAKMYQLLASGVDPIGVTLEYKNRLTVTVSGSNITIDTGAAWVQGHLVEVTSPITMPVPSTVTSVGTVAIKLDLSQANTASGDPMTADYTVTNNQVSIVIVKGNAYQHAPNSEVVQDHIFEDGSVFMYPFAQITRSGSTITAKNDSGYFYNLVPYLTSSFKPYSKSNLSWLFGVTKIGAMVTIVGALTNTVDIAANADVSILKTNPFGLSLSPAYEADFLCSGSGTRQWLLDVGSDTGAGLTMGFGRYRASNTYEVCSKHSWLAVSGATWSNAGHNTGFTGIQDA